MWERSLLSLSGDGERRKADNPGGVYDVSSRRGKHQ